MSSLDFANALFSKYQQSAASCSTLLFKDSATSPFPSSSTAPAMPSSCTLVSSGYHPHASSGRGSGGLSFNPSSSSSSLSSSSSSSSSFSLSLSGLNRSCGSSQPGAHPVYPAEVRTGGAYSAPGSGSLCASLQESAEERFPGRPQLCSLTSRLLEPACRRQSSPEQQQRRLNEEVQRIYPWMRSSGE